MTNINQTRDQTQGVVLVILYLVLLYIYFKSCSDSSYSPNNNIEAPNVLGL